MAMAHLFPITLPHTLHAHFATPCRFSLHCISTTNPLCLGGGSEACSFSALCCKFERLSLLHVGEAQPGNTCVLLYNFQAFSSCTTETLFHSTAPFLPSLPCPSPSACILLSDSLTPLGPSHRWNHTVFVSLGLAHFTKHTVFKVHPCCSTLQNSFLPS